MSSTSTPTTTFSEDDHSEASKAACAELERLCLLSTDFFNNRELFNNTSDAGRELLLHVSPGCTVQFDNYPGTMTVAEFLDIVKDRAGNDPSFHFTPKQIQAHVDLKKGTGIVYLEDEKNDQTGIVLTGLCEMEWKLFDEKWMLCHFSRMYSMKGTTGTSWLV